VILVNLSANDKRLSKKALYDSFEDYPDGHVDILPSGWPNGVAPIYILIGNDKPKLGFGEVGRDISAHKLQIYEIEGMGAPIGEDEFGNPMYADYDLVVSDSMWEKATEKSKAKFENADYNKRARGAGVSVGVFIFFDTFEAYTPHPKKDPSMMPGKEMARALQGKNDCFKPFLSGAGALQFEKEKFHDWLRENGELISEPGLKNKKFKLNGGSLGEMVIEHRIPEGVPKYSLKFKK